VEFQKLPSILRCRYAAINVKAPPKTARCCILIPGQEAQTSPMSPAIWRQMFELVPADNSIEPDPPPHCCGSG